MPRPRVFSISLFAVILCRASLCATAEDSEDLWRSEQAHIEKIAQFTAKEHAAILFTVYETVGYASEGTARKLDLPRGNSLCLRNPALSHSGRYLAYLNGEQSEHCEVRVLELATGKVRALAELAHHPQELSWSWDDSEIEFVDMKDFSPSIQAVSLQDGSMRVLVPPSQLKVYPRASGDILRFDERFRLGGSHSGGELLADFAREVPTKQANVYSRHPVVVRIQLEKGNALAEVGDGYGVVASPVADRIAWYQDSKIVAANIDGSDRKVLTGVPRWMGIFPGDFKGPLVWGPDGNRLLFGTFESETCRDSVYLLRADTRHAKRFLSKTCILILDWRSSESGQK